ncbi:MAG: DEAD/DEAH box helicase, partial [Halomonadaceae bacterium]
PDAVTPPDVAINARSHTPLAALEHFINQQPNTRLLFVAESRGRREALEDLLAPLSLKLAHVERFTDFIGGSERFALTEGQVDAGLWLETQNVVVITETELFGNVVRQSRRREKATDDNEFAVRHLSELKPGAPVVHQAHGVGRYLGLEALEAGGQASEFLALEYANGARLYVPVDSLHLISRYSGADDEHAPLHKLGSDQWEKARKKAAEKIRDTAAELLDIYARREAQQGVVYDTPGDDYQRFSASFPFEETPDQEAAIHAVVNDLTAPQPMDRVICGDVGFGKTEVAMRAAFLATQSNRQVVVLVPTTLLARQHYENFRDRFADTAVTIELVSRFTGDQGKQGQQSAIQRIADGKVDIIIGTHKLLSKSISFPNIGLLIIDEEHRFGVTQKEKLKSLRAEVDILTLTATPIPRTLNMAMNGIRDLSIIATPPARRLSVKTFVKRRDDALIKEALLREILRGGQVYVL